MSYDTLLTIKIIIHPIVESFSLGLHHLTIYPKQT